MEYKGATSDLMEEWLSEMVAEAGSRGDFKKEANDLWAAAMEADHVRVAYGACILHMMSTTVIGGDHVAALRGPLKIFLQMGVAIGRGMAEREREDQELNKMVGGDR